MATLSPLPCLVGLTAPDGHPVAVRHLLKIRDLQRHQLGAPEGAGETEGGQRVVPLAGERVRAEAQHGGEHVGGGLVLALGGQRLGAADAA